MRTSGSIIFNTSVVRTDEYLLLAKILHNEGMSLADTASTIEHIDSMLLLQRTHLLGNKRTKTGRVRKDASILSSLDMAFDKYIEAINNHTQDVYDQTTNT